MKRCSLCSVEKPAEDFYRKGEKALSSRCKACCKEEWKRWVKNNPEKRKQQMKKFNAAHPERNRARVARWLERNPGYRYAGIGESVKKWMAANPEKLAAHRQVRNALRRGALMRHPCWVCGSKAEAHHPDYSAPLDVVWLCKIHHAQAHRAHLEPEATKDA